MTTDPNAGAAPLWFDGFDAETKGYVQNKGLDKKTPVEAFAEVSRFHREAEKLIGAPADEMVRLPKDVNSPEYEKLYARLGKPDAVEKYDFSTVKRAGDKPIDNALADALRKVAFDTNMSVPNAQRVASEVIKHLDAQETTAVAEATAALETERAKLKANWGVNEAANMVIARGAAAALGVKPEVVAALEKQVGYSEIMEMFRSIGTKIGEDKFVSSQAGNGGVMTRDQAVAEKKELMTDKAWRTRYIDGGKDERRKMLALDTIITGVG